ncbi:MAG TPA: GntR family transcriptional regulator [Jiangellales bacterium]|nr:GntR family transcriptional regulator [Jiangellales bacterium]
MTEPSVNPGAAEHPHRQIAASLRERIRAGEWVAGERLPSIPALSQAYAVAKQTVQRTIDQLRVEGLLITRPGSGTYVRGTRRRLSRLARARYGPRRGYHVDLAARYRQVLTEVGVATAPPEVTEAFNVPAGSSLLARRHLVRSDEDQPVEVGASWFLPTDVTATSIMDSQSYGRPLYQEVEEQTGRVYASGEDRLTARLPTREEATALRIRPDTPVLHLLHIGYDAKHRPIEVATATWPGPMTTLTDTYPVPAPLEP